MASWEQGFSGPLSQPRSSSQPLTLPFAFAALRARDQPCLPQDGRPVSTPSEAETRSRDVEWPHLTGEGAEAERKEVASQGPRATAKHPEDRNHAWPRLWSAPQCLPLVCQSVSTAPFNFKHESTRRALK